MSAPGVPLWNTPLLPCIFTASALDTGVALVMLVDLFARGDAEASARARRVAEVATVCLVAFEAVCVAVFCQVMLNGGTLGPAVSGSEAETAVESVGVLLTGELAPLFWGWFVVAGLVVPFVCALVGLVAKEGVGRVVGALGGAFALVGGCVLRFVVLMAGLHADILADAVSAIVFH